MKYLTKLTICRIRIAMLLVSTHRIIGRTSKEITQTVISAFKKSKKGKYKQKQTALLKLWVFSGDLAILPRKSTAPCSHNKKIKIIKNDENYY